MSKLYNFVHPTQLNPLVILDGSSMLFKLYFQSFNLTCIRVMFSQWQFSIYLLTDLGYYRD